MGQITGHRRPASSPAAAAAAPVEALINVPAAAATPIGYRRNPVILRGTSKQSARFAEVAGRTIAECAAICCCCPCGIVNLVILAVVRLPAGLCRRALRKRTLRRSSKKSSALIGSTSSSGSGTSGSSKTGSSIDENFPEFCRMGVVMVVGDPWPARSPSTELIQLEKEVWSNFYGCGFWRSPSQREDDH
ncbi:hypothetical protein AXF42_Ash007554 [Apostasia shenzhenica]|uniref:Uncharacterized protein n=1 Tax=Apostasia shenzhenica TaxID=1088818 RepID=A0A2I0A5S6_9ASPA|nr:hypothetical protein AXF42_Ash007554 [Apostasia shenzhenica]